MKATIQKGNRVTIESYTYDYAGNRTSKTVDENDTTYYVSDTSVDLSQVVAETDEAGIASETISARIKAAFYEAKGKRKNAIGRFCHTSLQYLDDSKILIKGKTVTEQEIKNVVKKNIDKEWYLISWDENFDGETYEIEKALDIIINMGMASIMICGDYAIVIEEQENGAPNKYILYNSSNNY